MPLTLGNSLKLCAKARFPRQAATLRAAAKRLYDDVEHGWREPLPPLAVVRRKRRGGIEAMLRQFARLHNALDATLESFDPLPKRYRKRQDRMSDGGHES